MEKGLSITTVIKGIHMIVEVEVFRVTGIESGAKCRIYLYPPLCADR
jgi:hypothetical protein